MRILADTEPGVVAYLSVQEVGEADERERDRHCGSFIEEDE